MESTAFNQAGWNPLHLIGMHFTMLHGMYCIQSRCMEFTAFNWDPLHHDASNPLRSIKIHCTTLHGIHCILSRSIGPRCIESTAFIWTTAWKFLRKLNVELPYDPASPLLGIYLGKSTSLSPK